MPKIRIATSGTLAVAQDYGDSTATTNRVLASNGPGVPPDWVGVNALVTAYYATNWAQAVWYLNGATGSDSNSGTSSAAPLQTAAELTRRLGPWAMWRGINVTIHIQYPGLGDELVVAGQIDQGWHVDIIGEPAQNDVIAITTYTPMNHGAANGPQCTSVDVANWTPGNIIRQLTGTNAGTFCYVLADTAGTALTTPWCRLSTAGSTVVTALPPELTETFSLEVPPSVPAIDLRVSSPWQGTAGVINNNRVASVQQCLVRGGLRANVQGDSDSALLLVACEIDGPIETTQAPWHATGPQGCLLRVPFLANLAPNYCGFLPCNLSSSPTRLETSGVVTLTHSVSYQREIYCQRSTLTIDDCHSQEWTSQGAVVLQRPGVLNLSSQGFSGRSTVAGTYGLVISNGCQINWSGMAAINVSGVVGEVRLNNSTPTPANTRTWAEFKDAYKNDGLQQWSAVLAAGTVSRGPTWCDITSQLPWVTRVTPGGTPGNLSCSIVSATQLTVASDSALDTSTVAFGLTRTGRNIVVVEY